ncbi:MAG: OmpA family protein [Steroidobacteraceae bacterium]
MSSNLKIILGFAILAGTLIFCALRHTGATPGGGVPATVALAPAGPSSGAVGRPFGGESQQMPTPAASVGSRLAGEERDAGQARIAAVLKLQNVEFVTGSATITSRGAATLDEIAAILGQNPGMRYEVAGYSDSKGNAAHNQALSQARATATVDYLVSKGLPRERFVPKGYGSAHPIADNRTLDGRRKNRRIEFVANGG